MSGEVHAVKAAGSDWRAHGLRGRLTELLAMTAIYEIGVMPGTSSCSVGRGYEIAASYKA